MQKTFLPQTVLSRSTAAAVWFSRVAARSLLAMTVVFGAFAPAVHAAPASASLPNFVDIVEKVEKGVVNIRTTSTITANQGFPGGRDPFEMFRKFFGPDFQVPGMPNTPERGKTPSEPEERTVPRGVGSGFFISNDGSILTNNHVIAGASEIFVTTIDGREYKAKVVGADERTDVALIKIDESNTPALQIGSAKNLRKGEWVLAIGSPFGLDSTVTAGIISAIGRETGDYLPFIQTDVAVNPGNSGGPLLDLEGKVIGINSQIVSRSGGFMGISLAIPIDEAMEVVDQLRKEGKVTRGRIGVQISEVSKDIALASGLDKDEGAMVSRVMPDSPAQKAGVMPGDIILSFNGRKIERWSDLPRIVGQTRPGTEATVVVWRKGKKVDLKIKVDELPSTQVASAEPEATPASGQSVMGITVVDLSEKDRSALGVEGGVRVTEVSGSGASAGLLPGDIILTVGNTDVKGAKQFVKLVNEAGKDKPIGLLVQRDGQTQWFLLRPKKS